jgi:hypothetical protein
VPARNGGAGVDPGSVPAAAAAAAAGSSAAAALLSRYRSDFQELQPLGRGGFGVVVAAINRCVCVRTCVCLTDTSLDTPLWTEVNTHEHTHANTTEHERARTHKHTQKHTHAGLMGGDMLSRRSPSLTAALVEVAMLASCGRWQR